MLADMLKVHNFWPKQNGDFFKSLAPCVLYYPTRGTECILTTGSWGTSLFTMGTFVLSTCDIF